MNHPTKTEHAEHSVMVLVNDDAFYRTTAKRAIRTVLAFPSDTQQARLIALMMVFYRLAFDRLTMAGLRDDDGGIINGAALLAERYQEELEDTRAKAVQS